MHFLFEKKKEEKYPTYSLNRLINYYYGTTLSSKIELVKVEKLMYDRLNILQNGIRKLSNIYSFDTMGLINDQAIQCHHFKHRNNVAYQNQKREFWKSLETANYIWQKCFVNFDHYYPQSQHVQIIIIKKLI